ncbi:MAG: hypothetical protein WCX61_05870 [Candidatus Peribacteraceae bacterium]|jgi:hypothetical protein
MTRRRRLPKAEGDVIPDTFDPDLLASAGQEASPAAKEFLHGQRASTAQSAKELMEKQEEK